MKLKNVVMAGVILASACAVEAQVAVKHLQPNEKSPIANGVWAGDTLYLSGQLADPVTPADPAKGTAAVYGDTKAQAFSALTKIQGLLKAQGLDMKDVVKMTVFLAGDPEKGGKLDFPGCRRVIRSSSARRISLISRLAARCRLQHWRLPGRWWRLK